MKAESAFDGIHKAAILLVLLGEEASGRIYRNLPQDDVRKLTEQIAQLHYVSPEDALQVLDEYNKLTITQGYLAQGGSDYAHKLLVNAFGEDGATQLLEHVSRAAEMSAAQLESLQKADTQQLAKFLNNEHPQTIALVMAHLDAKRASELVMRLPDGMRAEVIKRLAQLRQFSPEVAQKVSLVLHNRLQALGEQSRRAYAGLRGVADVMNRLEPNTSKAILETIEGDDAKLALGIRNLMFTFEDLIGVSEQGIRELLGQLDKKTLAMALRNTSEELKNLFFKSMSSRAVEMLKEDMEVLGPVRSRDVTKAQQEIVGAARALEAQGKITLMAESDEYVV
jgi:flagellar motor switch protein FliG